jgi:aspartate-semialdehyde dehydrogenase
MRIAVVGCTGLVGTEMLKVLKDSNINVTELIPIASEQSVGKEIVFNDSKHKVVGMEEGLKMSPQIALFSAGGETSRKWAPIFAQQGCFVVDNSSAWRMEPNIKLVVPEVNGSTLTENDKIIANPNCSTIQLVMVLSPLHRMYGIRRIVVSTYQAVTGTGYKAVRQLENERKGDFSYKVYPHPVDMNCIPQCDTFLDNGYTKEEMKLVNETRKILNDNSIGVSATAVRVPVVGGHSESVNIELGKSFSLSEVIYILENAPGVVVEDNPSENLYPMPLNSRNRDEVFVGRIREDISVNNGLNLWIVADNLRKGAATNAVQIAELIVKQGWVR